MLKRQGKELDGRDYTVDIEETLTDPCGPYRVLGLNFEAYGEELQAADASLNKADFALVQLAGSRSLRLRGLPPEGWLKLAYEARSRRRRKAAGAA